MSNFTVETNIERYANRLLTETDPTVRSTVKTLLIEEENRFGFRVEQLHRVDRYIADSHRRIEKQRRVVDASPHDGGEKNGSLRLLSYMKELLSLFHDYRELITASLERDRPYSVRPVRGNGFDGAALTAREAEVLTLLAQGNTSDGAAGVLGITRRTVDAHVEAILLKLDAANRVQAVALAIDAGIIKFN